MTAVAAGTWSEVGWSDPAPGSTADVRRLAGRFESQADELRSLNTELRQGVVGLESWQGAAADQFRAAYRTLSTGLDTFVVQYDRCVEALTRYVHALENDQREAAVLLPQVLAAFRNYRNPQVPPGLNPAEYTYQWSKVKAEAWAQIKYLSVRHDVIRGNHWRSARACDNALQSSDGSNALGRLFGDVADVLEAGQRRLAELGRDVNKWIHDNAEAISAVSDVIGDLGTAMSLIGMIPGLQAFAAAGAVLSAVAFLGHATAKYGGADIKTSDLVMDGIGVGLGAGAFAAARYLKNARGAAEALRAVDPAKTAEAVKGVQKLETISSTMDGLSKGYGEATRGKDLVETAGHLDKYWRPRNATQALVGATPGGAVGVAFWNAIEDGHQADVKARAGAR